MGIQMRLVSRSILLEEDSSVCELDLEFTFSH